MHENIVEAFFFFSCLFDIFTKMNSEVPHRRSPFSAASVLWKPRWRFVTNTFFFFIGRATIRPGTFEKSAHRPGTCSCFKCWQINETKSTDLMQPDTKIFFIKKVWNEARWFSLKKSSSALEGLTSTNLMSEQLSTRPPSWSDTPDLQRREQNQPAGGENGGFRVFLIILF